MLGKVRKIIAGIILAATPIASLALPGIAHAATITWTGGGSDGNWSTTANWLGGVAPVNGDSIVIDNAANFSNISTDDIAGLSLTGISFINDGAGSVGIALAQNLTITGPIEQQSSVTNTVDAIGGGGSNITVTLGGNVAISTTSGINLGDAGDTLALGGNTLTFNENTTAGSSVAIASDVSGNGSIVYNAPHTSFQLGGNNIYSGTTHVIATATGGVSKSSTDNSNPFGSSAITVETGGNIGLKGFTASTTLSNTFVITGTTSGSPVASMGFSASGTGVTLTVPSIMLNGDTRFSNDSVSALSVDLAGITANGHCVGYLGSGTGATDGPTNGFVNGPTGCAASTVAGNTDTTAAPGTPNTGSAFVTAHPVVTLLATTISALIILAIARKTAITTHR